MKLSLTAQCILALVLGLLVGTAASGLHPEALAPWLLAGDGVIRMWTNALQLTVLPLVVAQLFTAFAVRPEQDGQATRLGLLIPVVFLGLFIFVALCAIGLGAGLLSLPRFAGLSLGPVAPPPAALPAAGEGAFAWLPALVPSNIVLAASNGAILPLMFFTLAFALAARRLEPTLHQSLTTMSRAVAEAMFVIVGWLMLLAPPILFALAFRSTAKFGIDVGGALLVFLVVWTIVILFCLAVLYPVAMLAGVPLKRFARALFPAQMAAFAGRSSIATVPVLLHEAETTLGIPTRISALVIPAGAATLKLSQAVSPPLRALFLVGVLGIPLGPGQLAVFMVMALLLSPTVPGIPRMVSGISSLPAYLAIGIPPEYVMLLLPLNGLVDGLLTPLNTTGYMTANVLVARCAAGRLLAPRVEAEVSFRPHV